MNLRRISRIITSLLPLVALSVTMPRAAAVTVGFSQLEYYASPGQTLELTVNFSESVPEGLEGYALNLAFPTGILSVNQITVVPELDFDFLEPGALSDAGPGYAWVAGYTELGQPAYTGISFATFTVTVSPSAAFGQYALVLGLLQPDGDNFVDGTGTVIDDSLTFGTATLTIGAPIAVENFSITLEGDQMAIRFMGTPGIDYQIESSDDLSAQSWTLYSTVTAPVDGLVEVMVPLPASGQRVFYRVNSP